MAGDNIEAGVAPVSATETDGPKVEREQAQAVAPGGTSAVDVFDESGTNLGFKVHLAPRGEEVDDLLGLASRVKGWTHLVVDGEEFPYSEDNARTLVSRFAHVASSLRAHDEGDVA